MLFSVASRDHLVGHYVKLDTSLNWTGRTSEHQFEMSTCGGWKGRTKGSLEIGDVWTSLSVSFRVAID